MRLRCLLLSATLACATAASASPFDRAAWIADFEQVKGAITRQSPNLEWAVERGLDLPAVERRARDRLSVATGDAAARVALERFVRSFGDGHMALEWPSPATTEGAAAAPPPTTCTALGYWSEPDEATIASRLSGFTPLGSQVGQVRAGVMRIGETSVGVLRVPLFLPSDRDCLDVLEERGMPVMGACEETCAGMVARGANTLFLTAIADRLRLLTSAKADVLLIDVAGNGGGSDTAVMLARMIGGVDVPTPQLAYVKTAARLKDLEEDETTVRAGPNRATSTDRVLARRLGEALAQARVKASKPCDLSPIWAGRPTVCSNLIRGPFYAGGLVPFDPVGATQRGAWAETISSSAYYRFAPAQWNGPVAVLVDGSSASATEMFAAMLQDTGRAIIVGSPTYGSGCGWNMPRQDVILSNSGGRLSIPDCARFRSDGRNEIDGVEPDVLVGFRQFDTPKQRAQRLMARLPAAIALAKVQIVTGQRQAR